MRYFATTLAQVDSTFSLSHFHYISLGIIGVIMLGLIFRRKRNLHVGLMLTAMLADFGLVLWIELDREAVEQTLGMGDHDLPGPLLAFHIVLAVISLVLWIVQLVFGVRILRGATHLRQKHRIGAAFFIIFRFANFLTSLWI